MGGHRSSQRGGHNSSLGPRHHRQPPRRHGAVHLASLEDIGRTLRQAEGAGDGEVPRIAEEAAHMIDHERRLIRRLDEGARGLPPIELATAEFAHAVDELRRHRFGPMGWEPVLPAPRLGPALAERRSALRSAKYIRKHAPTHPGEPRWYHRFPLTLRAHAGYDWLRDFPHPESGMSDKKLAERFADTR